MPGATQHTGPGAGTGARLTTAHETPRGRVIPPGFEGKACRGLGRGLTSQARSCDCLAYQETRRGIMVQTEETAGRAARNAASRGPLHLGAVAPVHIGNSCGREQLAPHDCWSKHVLRSSTRAYYPWRSVWILWQVLDRSGRNASAG